MNLPTRHSALLLAVAPILCHCSSSGSAGAPDGGTPWARSTSAPASITPCTDCATLTSDADRLLRGGDFTYASAPMLPSTRYIVFPSDRNDNIGLRCARAM